MTCTHKDPRCPDFAEHNSEENICQCKRGYEYKYDEATQVESCENINECENTDPVCANGRDCIDKNPAVDDDMTHYCVCNPGEKRPGKQNICEPCATGHYCLNEKEFICPKGFFSDSRGSSTCSFCGYGSGTVSTGSKRMRDCFRQPYGFSAFLFESPKACEFKSFCPRGLSQMTPFYNNNKGKFSLYRRFYLNNLGLLICPGKENVEHGIGNFGYRKVPVPLTNEM